VRLQRRLPTVLSLCALLLAACDFQAITEIDSSGSGQLRTEVGFTPEERQRLEAQSGNAADFCATSRAPADVTVTEERRGDETWCITAIGFSDLDGLRELYGERNGVRVNRLEIAEGRLYYDLDLDTSSKESNFSTFSAITWTVVLPGTPVDHNAPQQIDNMLIWTLAPRTGIITLHAESRLDSPSSLEQAAPWLLGVLVLVLAVAALVLLYRR